MTTDFVVPQITSYLSSNPHPTERQQASGTFTNMTKEIGIFPASGGLGGSTYRHLLKLVPNDRVTLICRYPEKVEAEYKQTGVTVRKATYESTPQELELAFSGMEVLFLISYPSHVHDYRRKVSCRPKPDHVRRVL